MTVLITEPKNPEGLKFCNHCGTPLKSMARYAKCRIRQSSGGARFCGSAVLA
jgi:hypothetical protein